MAYRGLYHQAEGNEHNPHGAAEFMADSEVIEGRIVASLRSAFKHQDWTAFQYEQQQALRDGHSVSRVQSMVTRATVGTRL